MQVILENEILKVSINSFGAELASIVKKCTGEEYLWNGDERYWKRCAPVLFPFVGSLKNKEYLYQGKAYPMGQHGFARDMEFKLERTEKGEAWFSLEASEETKQKYPFAFFLELGYRLEGNRVESIWRVTNRDENEMYFSIGGHPAFMCPLNGEGKQTDYFISFDTEKDLVYSTVNGSGLVEKEDNVLHTDKGVAAISEDMFDRDALVIEGRQAGEVSLLRPDRKPYLTVRFDAPLFGIWSPAGKHAPFICIEPWYGRCDKAGFAGELSQREYGNSLEPQAVFEAGFQIEIV